MAEIELQNGKDATFRLQSLADKHPTSGLYLYWLARIDYDERRYDEAITKLNRVIELDPQSVRAYNSLGLAYDMQGQPEPARLALERHPACTATKPRHRHGLRMISAIFYCA